MHINETLHCQVVFSTWCSDGARLIVPCALSLKQQQVAQLQVSS